MAQSFISPTRQELLKLKEKYKSAKRGHKLLKDKRDSLVQIFIESYKKTFELRKIIDQNYLQIRDEFKIAINDINPNYITSIAETTQIELSIESKLKNIMGIKIQELTSHTQGSILNYSMLETNIHLDSSLIKLTNYLPQILELIQNEYKIRKLAEEIEKTRKRVNALEYVILPELAEQIKYINAKLNELALQNTVRLIKIKSQITQ